MKKIQIVAKKADRLLKVLQKQCPEVVYSAFSVALRQKDVLLNGVRIKENVYISEGDQVCVFVPDSAIKQNMFSIEYEDQNVIIVNKGKGIETSDGEFNVLNELIKQNKQAFAVHRLDRNTLGLVIFAKSVDAQKELINNFKNGNITKLYYAEVCGATQKHSLLHGFLVKDKNESEVKIYSNKVPNSQEIFTEYATIKNSGNVSLLQVKITEGKTHQIRAHLAYNKIYIIGDGKYGKNEINNKYKAKTQHLKAYKILFNLPQTSPLCYLNNLNLELNDRF